MNLQKNVIYFGLNENNQVRATNIVYKKEGTAKAQHPLLIIIIHFR